MNRTSPGTNALRHGSCRALVCRCRRASAAVVGGPIPLHATYITLTTPTTGDDDIPFMLQYVASAYHWRRRHTSHPCYALLHFWIAGRLPLKTRLKICTNAHTNTTSYAHRTWRRRTENIQAQAVTRCNASAWTFCFGAQGSS
jgi:hypothetical protein